MSDPAKNTNPTPRALFIQDATNVANHRKMIDSQMFTKSKDAALAEYTRAIVQLGGSNDLAGTGAQQGAAACFHMITGAYQFLEVFMRLAEPYAAAPAKDKIASLTSEN